MDNSENLTLREKSLRFYFVSEDGEQHDDQVELNRSYNVRVYLYLPATPWIHLLSNLHIFVFTANCPTFQRHRLLLVAVHRRVHSFGSQRNAHPPNGVLLCELCGRCI